MTGNAGRDTLSNSGTMTVNATASGGTQRTSVTLVGANLITATTSVLATASGLAGGDGNDLLRNSGTLNGTATAQARSTSLSAGLIGATLANADNSVDARITGLDGGGGADTISMDGSLTLTSFATGTGADRSATLVGGSVNSARTLASTTTLGILGGSGADTILHNGFKHIAGDQPDQQCCPRPRPHRAASGEADMLAGANGVGIDGGADDDQISVGAGSTLTLDSVARLTSVASSLSLAGLASSGGIGGATATALGVAGGSGNDGIAIAGLVDVGGTASLDVQASNFTLFGAASQAGRFRSTVNATGVGAGTGNDSIAFTGVGNVTGIATASYRASGLSAAGTASSDAAIGATARALGLGGGSGTNSITLDGVTETPFGVLARADSSLASGSQVFLGAAVSNGAASSISTATGIATDTGNDTITVNSGSASPAAPG